MDQDVSKLEAWIDNNGDGDQLHVRVTGPDGHEYDSIDADLQMLLEQEQYVNQLSRPSLTLLSLHNRAVQEARAEPDEELLDEDVVADGGE